MLEILTTEIIVDLWFLQLDMRPAVCWQDTALNRLELMYSVNILFFWSNNSCNI